jgi:hypothetical protein
MVKQSKEERAAQQALYYQANRVELAAKQKLYFARGNTEKRAAYKALYYRANRAELAAKQTLYRQATYAARSKEQNPGGQAERAKRYAVKANHRRAFRRRNDPVYAVSCRLRFRLWKCLKTAGAKKRVSTEALLGCSWQEAVDHLESNDRGFKIMDPGIEIDHIRPISSFRSLTCLIQQRLVNHPSNLQLLPAVENRQKSDSFDYSTWAATDAGRLNLALEQQWTLEAGQQAASVPE